MVTWLDGVHQMTPDTGWTLRGMSCFYLSSMPVIYVAPGLCTYIYIYCNKELSMIDCWMAWNGWLRDYGFKLDRLRNSCLKG